MWKILTYLWIVATILVITSECGTVPAGKNKSLNMFPDQTIKYVNLFETLHGGKPILSTIQFVPQEGNIIGRCYVGEFKVEVDPLYWVHADDMAREQLILHELGHCELFREHRNDLLPDIYSIDGKGVQCPASIMHWSFPVDCYQQNRGYYLRELFQDDQIPGQSDNQIYKDGKVTTDENNTDAISGSD